MGEHPTARFSMPTHLLFMDDSGTKEYAQPGQVYGEGVSRYFVFGGVLVPYSASGAIVRQLQSAKIATFGTPRVEIKSNWLRMPHERERRYLTPHKIGDAALTEFVNRYYEILDQSDFALIAAVVDKIQMAEDYPDPWYAPAVAYEILLQRVQNALGTEGTVGVTVDDMTGATPSGHQYKANLRTHHERLRRSGSQLRRGFAFPCLDGPVRFVNSAKSDMIQVADIAAYNVYRQFVDHGDAWEDAALKTLPTYEHFGKLQRKLRHDGTGRIQGYGVVKFPLRKRVPWSLRQD